MADEEFGIRAGEVAVPLPEKTDAGVYFVGRIRTPWTRREECPKNARESDAVCTIEVDPRYALAYFDLGNVLDETGRVQEAIQTYKTALQLAPTYADAHYNLALAFEKIREPRKALKHWQAYVKLDATGPWSVHARSQIQRILQADGLRLVRWSR